MIQTRLYTVSKNNNTGGNVIYSGGSSSGASSSKSINAIEGNIENLTSQTIYVTDKITAKNANIDNILGDVINSSYISSYYIVSDDINTNSIFAYTTGTDKLNFSYWSINEDTNNNLLIHSEYDKQLSILPNNIDVLDVMSDKVKINKTLDLTNEIEGTNVYLGGQKLLENNTNIKSIEEQGFYICDENNNIALGISGNYVQAGADIGSPNFFSGVQGWRIQPDGTGEFQNLKVNGNLDVFVLTYNEMRATNGILLVTDAGCITDAISKIIDNVGYWIFTIDEFPPFAIDDYVQLQYRSDETRIFSFKGIVTAINKDGKNTVRVLPLSGFAGEGTSTDDRGVTTFRTVDTETCSGEYLIRIGNKTDANRQTIIKLNPYDGGYIDFMKGLNSENALAPNTNLPVATRLGNLTGVVYKGTKLNGYGLFSDNAYLTGAIKNLQDKWALNNDGSGNLAGEHIKWDKDGNLTIKLGDTELTQYIQNVQDDLSGEITNVETTLRGEISTSAAGITAEFNKTIKETKTELNNNINGVSDDLHNNYSTTTVMNSAISASAESLTADFSKTITTTYNNLNSYINGVSDDLHNNYSTTTVMNSAISASAESLTANFDKTITEINTNIDGVSNDLHNNYSTTTQMNSSIQTSASGVTSTVNKTINEKYTDLDGKITTSKTELSSEISQTADNIRLKVMNCGVDIDNERIRLNGDTLIEGNLTVQGDGVGFTLGGSGGTTQIISDSIGSWNSFSATSMVRQTKSSYTVTNPTTVSGKYQHTMTQWLYFGWVNSGNTVTFNSFDTSLQPSSFSTANNTFTFYIDGTEIGTASYTGIRNSLVNKSFTATKSGNLQVKRTMTLTTTTSGQYSAFLYLTVTYATNAYSKIAYDGMGFNLGNGHHIFCNGTEGVRIGNPSWEQVYTLDGIETYFPQGRSFNDNGTIRTDIATTDETQKSVKFGQKRVRAITSTGILYLQPHDQILKVSTTDDRTKIYLMLGRPSQRKGWNFTLLYGENINVVADTSGTTNAQRLNAAFIHHFYCDGVFWYYQGGSRTCMFNTSTTHAYG